MRSLSEMLIANTSKQDGWRKLLPVAWLAAWLVAVMSVAVPYWWVTGLLAIAFWELTWQMSATDMAATLSLERVDRKAIQLAMGAAFALFTLYCMAVKQWHLPVYGKVASGRVLWAALISPVNEELFFRGLMFNGLLVLWRKWRREKVLQILVILIVTLVFAAAHARSGIYLALTVFAGSVYGGLRLKSGSVIPGILCHALFNSLVMWTFGR